MITDYDDTLAAIEYLIDRNRGLKGERSGLDHHTQAGFNRMNAINREMADNIALIRRAREKLPPIVPASQTTP